MEETYGVWAVRSAASIFGHAESWCKENGKPLEFDSREAAEAYAREMNSKTTANVHYYVKDKEPEPGAVKSARHSRIWMPALPPRSRPGMIRRKKGMRFPAGRSQRSRTLWWRSGPRYTATMPAWSL